MKARLIGSVMLACVGGGALASGYSDFNAGISAHNRGDWNETLRRTTAALAAPDLLRGFRFPALVDRGDAHAALHEWDLAAADYSAALAQEPGSVDTLLRRAIALREGKHYPEAIADYSAVIRLRPRMTAGFEGRAAAYDQAGDVDAAIADYTLVIALDASNADAFFFRGALHLRHRDLDAAIADEGAAIAIDKKYVSAYFERAQAYEDGGQYRDAIADDEDGLRLTPDDANGRMQLGLAQFSDGRFSDAATTFAQMAQVRPAYRELWLALSQARALVTWQVGLSRGAERLDLTHWPGPVIRLFLNQSEPDEVMRAAEHGDAETRANQICEANFYIGEWLIVKSQKKAAASWMNDARDKCPINFVERDAAIAELARLE
ncbi:MAG TPA: tetratricopeptide repeat protein [Rhizomicrobium sp.]|jgi:lipoprotein NlpI